MFAVAEATDRGWFVGFDDGTFRPDDPLTEEHAAIVFARVFPEGITRAEFAAFLIDREAN